MHKIIKRDKKFIKEIKKVLVSGAILIALLLANTDSTSPNDKAEAYRDLVFSSTNLTEEDKNILINDDLFLDIASSNSSRFQDFILRHRLSDLKIIDYTEDDLKNSALRHSDGYYQSIIPNVLHIRGYTGEITTYTKDSTTHEFIHLLQLRNGYSYIIEATAEIISNEYYDSPMDSYKQEIIRVKVLMELLGPECIWQYLEGNGILSLALNISEYLSPVETFNFLKLLSTTPNSTNKNYDKEKINSQIDYYLAKIYLKKYGVEISNDLLISAIYDGKEVNRLYFNTDRRNSNNYTTFALTHEDAIKKGYDLDGNSDDYKIVAILDDYVIIEEKVKEVQLNLTQ